MYRTVRKPLAGDYSYTPFFCRQARRIFEHICGTEEEFLPAAPNPEDIIYDDGEGKTPADSGFSSGDAEGEKEDGAGNGVEFSGDAGTEVAQVEKKAEGGTEGSDALLELGGLEGATGNVQGDA